MIRVMVVDDQKLIRDGLKIMIELEDDLQWVGEACNGREGYERAKEVQPDVVLMDIRMPGSDGVEGTRLIHQWNPQVKVLILTTFDDEQYVLDALREGGCGYLLKDIPAQELLQAVRTVHQGGGVLQPEITAKVLSHIKHQSETANGLIKQGVDEQATCVDHSQDQLTVREREILRYISKGYSNQQMAEQLHITEGTVKNHVSNIMNKLELHDRNHLTIFALTGKRPEVN